MAKNYKMKTVDMPIIPLRGISIFPYMVLHFDVGREKSIIALEEAMVNEQLVFLTTQKDPEIDIPTEDDFYNIGTVCKIKQMLKLPGNTIRVLVEGISRAKIKELYQIEPYFRAKIQEAIYSEELREEKDIDATMRLVLDTFEEYVNIGGIPLKIVDTAGIRETDDLVEKIGVQKSKESFESADLVIMMLDSSRHLSSQDQDILSLLGDKKAIILVNKTDLPSMVTDDEIHNYAKGKPIIRISALEKKGIDLLEKEIENMVLEGSLKTQNDIMVTNARHKMALERAFEACSDALTALADNIPLDIAETDFKNAWNELGHITGDTVSEDLLDTIFREFCIGK